MKGILLLIAVLSASVAQVSKKCKKTNKAYPGKVATRPVTVTDSARCGMFESSCCTFLTEHLMYEKTDNFADIVFARAAGRLATIKAAISDDSLTPIFFSKSFNNLVKQQGNVTYQMLIKEVLTYFIRNTDECNNHILSAELPGRIIYPVKVISNRLKAIYEGLTTIELVLEKIPEYTLSDECKLAVMKNGLTTSADMKNSMCQVCTIESFNSRTCQNTCKNVARGCINDFTQVENLLNELINNLDRVHNALIEDMELPSGALKSVQDDIQLIFDYEPSYNELCYTGNSLNFTVKGTSAIKHSFSDKPLALENLFQKSSDFACVMSLSNKNCFTATGMTDEDMQFVTEYTIYDQINNNVLPRAETPPQMVLDIEKILRDAQHFVEKAYRNEDVFATHDDITPTTDKEPEEDGDSFGSIDKKNEQSMDEELASGGIGKENENIIHKNDIEDNNDDMSDNKENMNDDKDDRIENKGDPTDKNNDMDNVKDVKTDDESNSNRTNNLTNEDIEKSEDYESGDNDIVNDKNAENNNSIEKENEPTEKLDTKNIEEGAAKDSSGYILQASLVTLIVSLYFQA